MRTAISIHPGNFACAPSCYSLGDRASAITLDAALANALEKNPVILEAKRAPRTSRGASCRFARDRLSRCASSMPGGRQGGKRAGERTNTTVRLCARIFLPAAFRRRNSRFVSTRKHRSSAGSAAPERRRDRATSRRTCRLLHRGVSRLAPHAR